MTNMKETTMNRTLTSPVWSYFKVCEEDPVQADCLLCGIRMSRGGSSPNRCGTTNLRRHILYSHKISLPSVKNNSLKVSANENELCLSSSEDTQLENRYIALPSDKITQTIDKLTKNATLIVKSTKKPPFKKQSMGKPSKMSKKNESVSNKVLKHGELKKSLMLAEKISEKERILKEEIEWFSHPQPDPVMCIKWNTYLSNMTVTLPNFLKDEQFVDVTLSCEGQSLKCHKILLAACSPYFLELLSDVACRHPTIVFKDYRFWELQVLVSFMYCGEVNVPQSQLSRILHVAEALQIKGLAQPTSTNSDAESVPEVESPPLSPYSSDLENMEPPVVESAKRKRKPSPLNYCKNHSKVQTVKSKPKTQNVKSRNRSRSIKVKTLQEPKKISISPAKKRKLSPAKKSMKSKKSMKKKVETKPPQLLSRSSSPVSCSHLPELLASDLPDMLNDILSSNIMEGISLPEALKVGTVDGSLSLQHFDPGKMELGEEDTPFLANGLAHELLHMNAESKLMKDEHGGS